MTAIDGFEFLGEPFDPRPSAPRPENGRIPTLLAQARATVAAAHASALEAQMQLQRRQLSAPGGRP